MRRLPDDCPLQTGFVAALELFDPMIDVVHWNRRDADQSIGIDAAIIDQPIVIDAKTGFLQAGIIEGEQIEHQSRIEHFSTEAVRFHLFHPGAWIPTAGMLLKTFAHLMWRKERRRLSILLRHTFFP